MNSQSELVRLSGLATRLRLPARWLKAEAVAGRIPCLKVQRHFLFNVEAVRRSLADRAALSSARAVDNG